MIKQSNRFLTLAKGIGWGAANTAYNVGLRPFDLGLRGIGKLTHKATGGAYGNGLMRSTEWGDSISKNYNRYVDRADNWVANATGSKGLGKATRIATKYVAPTAATAYAVTAPDNDSLWTAPARGIRAAMQWTPTGLVAERAMRGVEKGVGYAKNYIADQAYNIMQRTAESTADQIATGIGQSGRMAHLYGAINPEGYAAEVRKRAMGQLQAKISDMRRTGWDGLMQLRNQQQPR